MITTKAGVVLTTRGPALARIVEALRLASRACGKGLVVTCGNEGHGPADPHTLGEALDVGTLTLTSADVVLVHATIRHALGAAFYVQYETPTPPADPALAAIAVVSGAASAPHLHIQRAKGTTYTVAQYLAEPMV